MGTSEGNPASGKTLLVLLYREIRMLAREHMRGERSNHTLTTTALVNEVYLRVAAGNQQFRSEAAFAAAASGIMRRVLVDHARARNSEKRGGMQEVVQLSTLTFDVSETEKADIEALDEALQELARVDERQARVVEMRFFGGLSVEEIAGELGVSPKTVKRDWATARSWLRESLRS